MYSVLRPTATATGSCCINSTATCSSAHGNYQHYTSKMYFLFPSRRVSNLLVLLQIEHPPYRKPLALTFVAEAGNDSTLPMHSFKYIDTYKILKLIHNVGQIKET